MPDVTFLGPLLGRGLFVVGPEGAVHPEEIERVIGKPFSPEEMEFLERIPFPEDVLWGCRKTHLLWPGPPLSLVEVQRAFNYPTFGRWWAADEVSDRFSRIETRWHLMRRGAIHAFADFEQQQARLSPEEAIPSVAAVAFIHHFCAKTGRKPFVTASARCQDGTAVMPSSYGIGIHNEGLQAGRPGIMVERIPMAIPVNT